MSEGCFPTPVRYDMCAIRSVRCRSVHPVSPDAAPLVTSSVTAGSGSVTGSAVRGLGDGPVAEHELAGLPQGVVLTPAFLNASSSG